MGGIKTIYSAVENYVCSSSDNYILMINTANEILSRIEKLFTDVRENYEKINYQIARFQPMQEKLSLKIKSYKSNMDVADAEVKRWQAEIDYLKSHPDTITTTDDDGNETTEEVYDYDAINAADARKEESEKLYRFYRGKHNEAKRLLADVETTKNDFRTIKNAISEVGESIQSDLLEVKKYVRAIGDEAEYNTRSLQGVLGSLSTYLASKAMFMPTGAIYEDFASSGGSSYSASASSNSSGSVLTSIKKSTSAIHYNSTYQERLQQTPISNGNWAGQRGESLFISNNNNANKYLRDKGVNGILYSNGIPDFSIVSKGTVEIKNMSDKRPLNFRQADEKLAKEKGCSPREVKEWRETNKYTWHECNDMSTCMKIPSVINGTFGHLGGVSECSKALEDDFDE